jgi:hypothetical protein
MRSSTNSFASTLPTVFPALSRASPTLLATVPIVLDSVLMASLSMLLRLSLIVVEITLLRLLLGMPGTSSQGCASAAEADSLSEGL